MELFSKAWLKAVTPENICAGFRKADVVSFNADAITTAKSITTKSPAEDKEDTDKENTASFTNQQPQFTTEEIAKFTRRLEEGYDLFDPVYLRWLEQYHPEQLESYTASHLSPDTDDMQHPSLDMASPSVVLDNTKTLHFRDNIGDDSDKENRASDANQSQFSTAQVSVFTRRLEEGYDCYDPVYVSWLIQYHPGYLESYTDSCKSFPPDELTGVENSVSGFFSHVDPTEPLSIVTGENSAMLCTPLNKSSKAAASTCTPIRAMTGDEPSLFTDDPCSNASLNTHISRPSSLSCTPTSPASNVCFTKSPQCTPPTSSTCKRPATATTSPKTPTVGGGDTVTSVPGTSSKCGESKILASKSENYLSKYLTPITP